MKENKRRKLIISIIIVLVFVVGFIGGNVFSKLDFTSSSEDEATTEIVEVKVGTQTIENTLSSSGEVSYTSTSKLKPSTSKYFKTMCVEEGDIVKKGDKILKYSDGTYLKAKRLCLISSINVPTTGNICTSSNYIEVQNINVMKMTLSINESEINKIEKGQEVTVKISALDNKNFTGEITSVSSIGTYSTSGSTFEAVLEFKNDGNVKPGMSATCSIILEKAENAVAIPISAVQSKDSRKYVVVVNSDGSTKEVDIETGISNSNYVEIKSGLSAGETIQMVQVKSSSSNSKKGNRNGSSGNEKGSMNMQMFDGGGPGGQGGDMPQRPDFN